MRDSFFKDESVAIACEVSDNPEAKKELEELCVRAARDGVSLVCIDKTNGKIAAAAFNKLQIKNHPGDDTYFENFAKNCKQDASKGLVQFMIDADAACNLFEHYGVDCLLEIMFLATLPEYRKMGMGGKLTEISIELARKLFKGEMVKVPIDDAKLELDPVPKVVSAIFTSCITQKIGQNYGFNKTVEISFEKFFYKGKTFASKIGDHTPSTTLESIKL